MTVIVNATRMEAQAKLNLALRVLGKEPSGYHQIQTLFLRLELSDKVFVAPVPAKTSVRCDLDLGPEEGNLAYRAAKAYSAATGWPFGCAVEINKRIPTGAGLGGGSADAAAVLQALNKLSTAPLSPEGLQQVAATLGSDVPFMTSGAVFALGEGRGEKLTPLPAPEVREVVLAVPDFQVSTREAYSWIDEDGASVADRTPWILESPSWETIDRLVENDFERVVSRRHPGILTLISAMRKAGARTAGMTGSGSVVFGLFDAGSDTRNITVPPGVKLLRTRTANRVVQPQ